MWKRDTGAGAVCFATVTAGGDVGRTVMHGAPHSPFPITPYAAALSSIPPQALNGTFCPLAAPFCTEIQPYSQFVWRLEKVAVELKGKTVIVCEDEGTTVIFLRKILERAGMRVLACVTDGRDSVDQVLRERPQFVLMDSSLPNLDGIQAVRRILGTYHTYRPCIIMITTHSEEEDRREAMDAGAIGYVIKPFGGSALLAEIARAAETGQCGGETISEETPSPIEFRQQIEGDLAYSPSPA